MFVHTFCSCNARATTKLGGVFSNSLFGLELFLAGIAENANTFASLAAGIQHVTHSPFPDSVNF
jgi:hypothetical protein